MSLKDWLPISISGIALLISVFTWYKTQGLAEKEYQLKLTPKLLVETKLLNSKEKCTLEFKNTGPTTIHDIRIQHGAIVLLGDENRMGASMIQNNNQINAKYWKTIKELKPNQIKSISINHEEFLNTYKFFEMSLELSDSKENGNVFHLFFIKYNREPDNQEYELKKYIVVQKDNHNELAMTDLDFLAGFNTDAESAKQILDKRLSKNN
ncbi:MAG: hypothetical protein WC836_09545 [Desulfobacula sp.]|jgi:hypothetical protein